jgi:hypothetical protein
MQSSKFLDYEVALLIAKYGKPALLDALARKLQLTPEELERTLETIRNEQSVSRPKKRSASVALLSQLVSPLTIPAMNSSNLLC